MRFLVVDGLLTRLRPRAHPARLLTARCAAGSTGTVPEKPPATAVVAPGSCLVSLMFPDGAGAAPPQPQDLRQLLQVDRALLWHASPVLRGLLIESGSAVPCGAPPTDTLQQQPVGASGPASTNSPPTPAAAETAAAAATSKPGAAPAGTTTASNGSSSMSQMLLVLSGDNREDWAAVVQILLHTTLPVTWDNVGALLRLADKYDMAAVRTACAVFLAVSAHQMSLSEPLASPKNPLHAASLAEKHLMRGAGSGGGSSGSSSGSSSGGSDAASQQPDLQP
ncbi:hypothetical protein HXX76_002973 [Chlamydomonas incerta]|uniref:BTB domain-containing protein n=1 Tax=Chlamydomonas incerta TaxID=51695 RepID=A0A835TPI6_CHLIN|nr:hypothetical protein HXX76_002973 [Chlamydomonas incerta]|eukprot:KAG2442896.1 hypothetical protein HXX76_002973 [Chlamydomonas incerta]